MPVNNLNKKVLALAIPLMASNLSQTAFTLVDTAMLGRLGEPQLAAMGPAGVVYLVLFLVLAAVFMGVQILTSRRYGEGDLHACGQVFNGGLLLGALLGLVGGVLGVFLADPVSRFLAADPQVASLCGDYLTIRWGGVIGITVLWVFKGFYYGVGITRVDMMVALGTNMLNVLLNWMFLWGNLGAPEMGMSGAALASVIATGTAVLCYAMHALRPAFRDRFGLFRFNELNKSIVVRIAKLSGPRAVQALAFGGSIIFFKFIGDNCGNTALAASTIIWKYAGVAVLMSLAFGSAAATLVGQALGAGNPDLAEASTKRAAWLAFCMNCGIGMVALAIPATILSLFSSDPEIIAMGVGPLRLMALSQTIDGAAIVLSRALSGAGCTVYVMVAEIAASLGCVVPVGWFLTRYYSENLTVVWCAWSVYILAWFTANSIKFRGGSWKHVKV